LSKNILSFNILRWREVGRISERCHLSDGGGYDNYVVRSSRELQVISCALTGLKTRSAFFKLLNPPSAEDTYKQSAFAMLMELLR